MSNVAPAAEQDQSPLHADFRDPQLGVLFDHAPIAIVIVSVDRQFRRANPQACAYLGYSEDELRKLTFLDITHPDDVGLGMERMTELIAGQHERLRFNKRYIHKSGRVLSADVAINTVRDESGRPLYFISQIVDMTAQHAAETALRASEERYRSLVEEQTDLICRCRPDFTLTYVNEAYCRHRGMTREELLGRRYTELLPPDRRERIRAYNEDLLANPRVKREETRIVYDDGTVRWHQWVDSPIFDDAGNVVEIQSVERDITARKQAEQELERKAAIEQMLFRELDHRVRNNLSSLLALVDITREGTDDLDAFTDAIRGRVEAMATVHGLLSQSRTAPIRLKRLVAGLIPPDASGSIEARVGNITIPARQVSAVGMLVHELMTNSRKHGAQRAVGGRVLVEAERVASDRADADQIELRWTETGGEPPQPRPHGVGLELIRGLTHSELGGEVELSFPSTGAAHRFTLKLDQLGPIDNGTAR